jgi:hypothetical protein
VLEAMACGTPVVTTTGGSLPEVAGDAALLVEPGDAETLAVAIGKLAEDPGERVALVQRGLVRAAGFTWNRCAALTAEAYRRVTQYTAGTRAIGPSGRSSEDEKTRGAPPCRQSSWPEGSAPDCDR